MLNTKALFLGALLAGLAVVMLINEIGISRYPPAGQFPDGVIRGFYPADVRSCMGARALAAIGDRTSHWHWYRCATTLAQTQAVVGFDLRYWSLLLAGVFTLASAFGFALVVRFDRPSARVLRGRELLAAATAHLLEFDSVHARSSSSRNARSATWPSSSASATRPSPSISPCCAGMGWSARAGTDRQSGTPSAAPLRVRSSRRSIASTAGLRRGARHRHAGGELRWINVPGRQLSEIVPRSLQGEDADAYGPHGARLPWHCPAGAGECRQPLCRRAQQSVRREGGLRHRRKPSYRAGPGTHRGPRQAPEKQAPPFAHSGEGDQSFRRMATTYSNRWRPGGAGA